MSRLEEGGEEDEDAALVKRLEERHVSELETEAFFKVSVRRTTRFCLCRVTKPRKLIEFRT